MFLKELKDTLRQTGFILAFYMIVPLLYLVDQTFYNTGMSFLEYMSNGLDLFILIATMYLAYNIFKSEDDNDATEYLLSLPVSRWKLFLNKVTPRVIILIPLLAIGSVVFNLRTTGDVTCGLFLGWSRGFNFVASFVVFVQICGFMLGIIGRGSWITRLMLLVMVLCVWQYGCITLVLDRAIWFVFGFHTSIRVSFWLGRNGYVLINSIFNYVLLAYILVPLCRGWDLSSIRVREVWFQKRAFLPMLVFSLLLVSRYLTNSIWWW